MIRAQTDTADKERLRLMFRQGYSAAVVAVVAGIFCAVVIAIEMATWLPFTWCGAVLALSTYRILLYRRYFRTQPGHYPLSHWATRHALIGVAVGVLAGSLPLVVPNGAPTHIHVMETLVPAIVLMAAVTTFGVDSRQFGILIGATLLSATITQFTAYGTVALPSLGLLLLLAPSMVITARRYAESIAKSFEARRRSDSLIRQLTTSNNDLTHQNEVLARQQDMLEQEEHLAKHVFRQILVGGNQPLPGIHTWNQPMGSLSGDLIQTARGPAGDAYVLICDFTGHGLPAALGAMPASWVFLAMATKGLGVDTIARELNRKLGELLPTGYFCCAVIIRLSPERRHVEIWNGGLPPVKIKHQDHPDDDLVESHSLPIGVVDEPTFTAQPQVIALNPGDVIYAYTDGLIEAEDLDGAMWGQARLHAILDSPDLDTPKLPRLITAVLDHVSLAPTSDDISIVEIETLPSVDCETGADAPAEVEARAGAL